MYFVLYQQFIQKDKTAVASAIALFLTMVVSTMLISARQAQMQTVVLMSFLSSLLAIVEFAHFVSVVFVRIVI